jgi:predicted PurR-regulated permease PerM
MPAALLLFAMIGGIAVFGALGIVAGPLIVAFFRAVAEITRTYGPDAPAVPMTMA